MYFLGLEHSGVELLHSTSGILNEVSVSETADWGGRLHRRR